jgi:hypothetical protein
MVHLSEYNPDLWEQIKDYDELVHNHKGKTYIFSLEFDMIENGVYPMLSCDEYATKTLLVRKGDDLIRVFCRLDDNDIHYGWCSLNGNELVLHEENITSLEILNPIIYDELKDCKTLEVCYEHINYNASVTLEDLDYFENDWYSCGTIHGVKNNELEGDILVNTDRSVIRVDYWVVDTPGDVLDSTHYYNIMNIGNGKMILFEPPISLEEI